MGESVVFVNTRPGRFEAEPPFWAARGLGLDVVVVGDVPPPVPTSLFSELVLVDTFDLEALRDAVVRVARERGDVVGVLCWGDRDVEGVAAASAALGLPGNPPAAAEAARNKAVARTLLAAQSPHLVPPYAAVRSREDLEAVLTDFPLPAVLKPAGASSSKGIFVIRTADDARVAFDELERFTRPDVDPIFRHYPGELLLEGFIEGSEHSVEAVVVEGTVAAAVVTDKVVEPTFSIETHQTQPTALPPDHEQACLAAADAVVAALGLGTTAIHLELRVAPTGEVRVLECNARTGGGYITTHLVRLSTGYDMLTEVLRAHCRRGEVRPVPPAHTHAGSVQHLARESGTYRGLTGVDRALSRPGVVAVHLDAPLDSPVAQPPASYTSSVLASVVAVSGDHDDLVATLDAASADLRPEIS